MYILMNISTVCVVYDTSDHTALPSGCLAQQCGVEATQVFAVSRTDYSAPQAESRFRSCTVLPLPFVSKLFWKSRWNTPQIR